MSDEPCFLELREASILRSHGLWEHSFGPVNWKIGRGQFWAVGGGPGSGKSDLLAALSGLQRAVSGDLFLNGKAIGSMLLEEQERERRKLGLVFEAGGRLFRQMTVLENIILPLRYHHNLEPEAAVEQAAPIIKKFGLESFGQRMPGGLPRAWQPRVALARALVLRPKILLCDNPLGGLDMQQTEWWLEFLSRWRDGFELGIPVESVVVTSEHLGVWKTLATHPAVLRDDQLTPFGSWDELESRKDLWDEQLTHRRF